jgi:hypothetical protein
MYWYKTVCKNTLLHLSRERNRTEPWRFKLSAYNRKSLLAWLAGGLFFISALTACAPDQKATTAGLKYFDVKGYFHRDSARLTRLNKPVFKTVYHNGTTQSKKVHIDNWGTELSLFSESDINRPAWKNSYSVIAEGDILIYKAKDPELKTREILIKQLNGKVVYMLIYNKIKNPLYTNEEELTYFPDSLYQINKIQTVRLLGTNKYQIKGFFNQ